MMADRFRPPAHRPQRRPLGAQLEHLVSQLPDDVESLLEQLRSGSLGVDFRVRDADHAVDHLVDGLVTAASVLAGAQLIARRAGPTLAGVSIPGLVAAGVGVMTWQRLVARRETTRSWVTRARSLRPPGRG